MKDKYDNKEYADKVARDVRHMTSDAERAFLRSPENVEEWYRKLTHMKRAAEVAITSDRAERAEKRLKIHNREEWLNFMAERERWFAKNAWFLAGVEDKIAEAQSLRNGKDDRFEKAIQRHRLEMGYDPSEADEELWKVLDA